MSYETLTYAVADRIATITVNRPDKLNALNERVIAELGHAIDAARADATTSARSFSPARAARSSPARTSPSSSSTARSSAKRSRSAVRTVFRRFETSPKPTIAAVNGFASAAAASSRWRATFASRRKRAKFGQPEVKLGLLPGYGGTQRLPRLVGKGRALQLLLTGEMIDAQEAYRIGLVNKRRAGAIS